MRLPPWKQVTVEEIGYDPPLMRRWALIGVVLASAVAGCGSSDEPATNTTSARQEREEAQLRKDRAEQARVDRIVARELQAAREAKARSEPTPEPESEPAAERPPINEVQRESREFCAIFDQAKMAREYGVPNDLAAVADAYASEYRSGLRVNAEEGCIEGLTD
jgi:hypothetical protein